MEIFIDWIKSFKPFVSLGVIAAAIVIWKLFNKVYDTLEKRTAKSGGSVASVLRSIIKYAIWIVTILIVLQINGVNVGSILAGLGIVSVIIGLALQDAIKDMIMGIHIMTDGFFDIGDTIKVDGFEGVVTDFTLRTTKIKSIYDDNEYVICNRNIEKVTVSSKLNDIDIPLSYSDDAEKVREVLTGLAEKIKGVEGVEDCVFKGTSDFEGSDIRYKLRFWCDPKKRGDLRRMILGMIQDTIKDEGLHIPYNQIDVHMK